MDANQIWLLYSRFDRRDFCKEGLIKLLTLASLPFRVQAKWVDLSCHVRPDWVMQRNQCQEASYNSKRTCRNYYLNHIVMIMDYNRVCCIWLTKTWPVLENDVSYFGERSIAHGQISSPTFFCWRVFSPIIMRFSSTSVLLFPLAFISWPQSMWRSHLFVLESLGIWLWMICRFDGGSSEGHLPLSWVCVGQSSPPTIVQTLKRQLVGRRQHKYMS